MWSDLFRSWNGLSIIQAPPISFMDLKRFTDASFFGLGAYFDGA